MHACMHACMHTYIHTYFARVSERAASARKKKRNAHSVLSNILIWQSCLTQPRTLQISAILHKTSARNARKNVNIPARQTPCSNPPLFPALPRALCLQLKDIYIYIYIERERERVIIIIIIMIIYMHNNDKT